MTPVTLSAEIGGQHVPLTACDWVLWAACGCPIGVSVARYSPTEDDAWKAFYDRKRDIERAQRQGERLELMTHARWCAEVMLLMTVPCTHPPAPVKRANTRLAGHSLQAGGHPFEPDGNGGWRQRMFVAGVALCSCGATSPKYYTNAARRHWHREVHKPEVRAYEKGLTDD